MRIKSKDIAKALGISEATVSLALNDRKGVNPDTKRRIFEYIAETEGREEIKESENLGSVMMVNYIKNGNIMNRSRQDRKDNASDFNIDASNLCRRKGYNFINRTYDEKSDDWDDFLKECRENYVKGIYLMAAEMSQSDIYSFKKIGIPLVVGDNLLYDDGFNSFLIDNREGIRKAVDYLVEMGHSYIVYLAENSDIFNFVERRKAFVAEMASKDCGDAKNRIRHLGSSIDEIYHSMCDTLSSGLGRTTAFILESSYVSLGVIKALLEYNVRIPQDISLLGFDAIAGDAIPALELTLIKGTHTKRHLAGISHLLSQLEYDDGEVLRVYYKTKLIEGNSVFNKKKFIYV